MTDEPTSGEPASNTNRHSLRFSNVTDQAATHSASDLDRAKLTAKHGKNFNVAYSVSESYFARDIVKSTSLAPFTAKLRNPALRITEFKEEPRSRHDGIGETTLVTVNLARLTDLTRTAYTYTYNSRPYTVLCETLALDQISQMPKNSS